MLIFYIVSSKLLIVYLFKIVMLNKVFVRGYNLSLEENMFLLFLQFYIQLINKRFLIVYISERLIERRDKCDIDIYSDFKQKIYIIGVVK